VDGDLTATGYFDEYWDSVSDLMDTLGIETTDDTYDAEWSLLLECLPFVSIGEDPGVRREFSVRATSVDLLLDLVDREEEQLISESNRLWGELVEIYKRRGDEK
jgi:ribosome assembly protein YihI (activator of Der GTPase)